MDQEQHKKIASLVLQVVQNLQSHPAQWVNLANMGGALEAAGIQYRDYGFEKLRPFLEAFSEVLVFDNDTEEGKTPVYYVRPKGEGEDPLTQNPSQADADRETAALRQDGKLPSKDSWLFKWAYIEPSMLQKLAGLALEEKWYYGNEPGQEQESLPILYNYLAYTFKRLSFEKKVLLATDPERNEEYAAFNTGLVDRKYEYIYALFKENAKYNYSPYWYLLDFVVAGEDSGKTLIKVFNPLPERVDYFENKIQNMLYDTTTGDLYCDYIHIITERTDRLPEEFLEDNCPADFLTIDGVSLGDVCRLPAGDKRRIAYYQALGEKIKDTQRVLNRLKNRIEDAVELALKRVEWNYKTAIPMYFPTRNTGSLLLPLCLSDPHHVDLALVVERQPSGAYQGQTILPLDLAYSNSRLVARPDSDWLKTDAIVVRDGQAKME